MLHVFNAAGAPLGSSPVLLGLAVGDDLASSIGTRKPANIRIFCSSVNVPAAFYDVLVKPMSGARPAVVDVLPETRPVRTLPDLANGAAQGGGPIGAAAS